MDKILMKEITKLSKDLDRIGFVLKRIAELPPVVRMKRFKYDIEDTTSTIFGYEYMVREICE